VSATMYKAAQDVNEQRAGKIASVIMGTGITGLEVFGAVLCFQAGGAGWVLLGVLLAIFAIGTFSNTLSTLVGSY